MICPSKCRFHLGWILIVASLSLVSSSILDHDRYYGSKQVPMLLPNVSPKHKDSYLCISVEMPVNEEYIVEIYPNSTMEIAHHILVLGCQEPGYSDPGNPRAVWECNEMHPDPPPGLIYPKALPCKGGVTVIYDWARNASKLVLPDKVGFKVGKSTSIPFIIVQVHYAHVDRFLDGTTDQSGIIVTMVPGFTKQITKRARVLLLGTSGTIEANSIDRMETQCKIKQLIVMHPFAFRVHTHKFGTRVSGWLIRNGQWTLIGKDNPQNPQVFYPIEDEAMVVHQNDTLAARCTFNNYQPFPVSVGPSGDDEMCNFDLMFWVEGVHDLRLASCWSDGPPKYYWSKDPSLGPIPKFVDEEA